MWAQSQPPRLSCPRFVGRSQFQLAIRPVSCIRGGAYSGTCTVRRRNDGRRMNTLTRLKPFTITRPIRSRLGTRANHKRRSIHNSSSNSSNINRRHTRLNSISTSSHHPDRWCPACHLDNTAAQGYPYKEAPLPHPSFPTTRLISIDSCVPPRPSNSPIPTRPIIPSSNLPKLHRPSRHAHRPCPCHPIQTIRRMR